MAIKRKLGVEFLTEGFKVQRERGTLAGNVAEAAARKAAEAVGTPAFGLRSAAERVPTVRVTTGGGATAPDDAARKRAFLTYGLPILDLLAKEPSTGRTPRVLFDQLRAEVSMHIDFPEFELALDETAAQGYVAVVGKDLVYGDSLYGITQAGLAIAPTAG